ARRADRLRAGSLVAVLGAAGAGRRGDRPRLRAAGQIDARAELAAAGSRGAAAAGPDLLLAERAGPPLAAAPATRAGADRRGQPRQRGLAGAAGPLPAARAPEERAG